MDIVIFVVAGLTLLLNVEGGRFDERITVKLYNIPHSKWETSISDYFTAALTAAVNEFCTNDPEFCNLDSNWHQIHEYEEQHVRVHKAVYRTPWLTTRVSLVYPGVGGGYLREDAALGDPRYMPRHITAAIAKQMVTPFHEATGEYILFIEDEEFPLPPRNILNIVLSCCAMLVVAACLLIAYLTKSICGGEPEAVEKADDLDSVVLLGDQVPDVKHIEVPGENGSKLVVMQQTKHTAFIDVIDSTHSLDRV